jgi:hypothetical protein
MYKVYLRNIIFTKQTTLNLRNFLSYICVYMRLYIYIYIYIYIYNYATLDKLEIFIRPYFTIYLDDNMP